jgi:RHS repeat-associated protein
MRATAAPDLSSYSYSGTGYVTSDANMNVAQWFDYAPYGSVLATTNTGQTTAGRQFEGLFTDATNLVYSNARYLNPAQGQFITQDPVFWSMKQTLSNPQSLNAYSYALDNPIVQKDPSGLDNTSAIIALIQQAIAAIQAEINIISGGGGSSQSTSVAGGSGSASAQPSKASNSAGSQSNVFFTSWYSTTPAVSAGWTDTPVNPNLKSLPIRSSAVPKLQKLSSETGMTTDEILTQSSQSPNGEIDLHNDANINIYSPKSANGELIRITTNPEGDAIISAGTAQMSGVKNGIVNGRFVPEDPFFFSEPAPIAPDIILF